MMSSSQATTTWPEVTVRHLHWLVTSAAVGVVAVAVVGGVLNPAPWRWSLFWWGLAIGGVGIAHNEFVTRMGRRQNAAPRPRRIRIGGGRQLSHTLLWVSLGPLVGGLAAAWDLVWIDVAVGAYAAAVWLVALVVLFFVCRRANNPASD
jgi:MFS family permease